MDVVSDPSVSSSAPVIDPSSSFVSGRSKMSFTEKPVFVLVNDIFWWGGKMRREKLLHQLFGQSAALRQQHTHEKKKQKERRCLRKKSDEYQSLCVEVQSK